MRTLWHDLRYGFRVLMAAPGFTAVAAGTLALGIAISTTVFSWVDGILLRPYPGASGGDRLVILETITEGAPNGSNQFSWLDYLDYRDNLKSLSGLAVHDDEVLSLGNETGAEALWGELVSGNYFDVLGLKAALGRT